MFAGYRHALGHAPGRFKRVPIRLCKGRARRFTLAAASCLMMRMRSNIADSYVIASALQAHCITRGVTGSGQASFSQKKTSIKSYGRQRKRTGRYRIQLAAKPCTPVQFWSWPPRNSLISLIIFEGRVWANPGRGARRSAAPAAHVETPGTTPGRREAVRQREAMAARIGPASASSTQGVTVISMTLDHCAYH